MYIYRERRYKLMYLLREFLRDKYIIIVNGQRTIMQFTINAIFQVRLLHILISTCYIYVYYILISTYYYLNALLHL